MNKLPTTEATALQRGRDRGELGQYQTDENSEMIMPLKKVFPTSDGDESGWESSRGSVRSGSTTRPSLISKGSTIEGKKKKGGLWGHIASFPRKVSNKSNDSSTKSKKSAKVTLPVNIPKHTRRQQQQQQQQQYPKRIWWNDDFMFPTARPVPSYAIGDATGGGTLGIHDDGPPIPSIVTIPIEVDDPQPTEKRRKR